MSAQDKNPRIIRPLPFLAQKKVRRGLYALGGLVLIILLVLLAQTIHNATDPNKKLSDQVKNLEDGHHQCSDGLNQLKPYVNISTSKHYSNATKEEVLGYIMGCEFMAGNTIQAQQYAQQLSKLYNEDGNTKKLQQLGLFINYMYKYKQ